MDQDRAAAYIRDRQRQREALPRLMALLRLGDRPASPSEEKYLLSWAAMGFEDAAIERAYDKTILKCKELKWPYMNKILTSWHEKGLHTLREVEDGDRPAPRRQAPQPQGAQAREDMARMERYLQRAAGAEQGKGGGRKWHRTPPSCPPPSGLSRRTETAGRRSWTGAPRRCSAACPEWRRSTGSCGAPWRRSWSPPLTGDTDPEPALRALEQHNLALQRERAELLVGAGYPYDYIDEKVQCQLCQDRGFLRDGSPCRCLMAYYTREQNRRLSKLLDLGGQSFDTFSFDWYSADVWPEYGRSPLENMEMIREICGNYAHTFGPRSGNLLFTGPPGLGKTFLSACIAREVSDLGFSVVYDTAAHVFHQFESENSAGRTPTRRTRTGRSTATSTATC